MSDDDYYEENEGVRVFGMGAGTFAIFVLFLALVTAWTLSIPCRQVPMLVTRWCSLLIFTIVSLLLIFADRETRYTNQEYGETKYEENLPARIACTLFMLLATIASVILIIFGPASDSFLTTSHDVNVNSLWVD